MNRLIAMIIRIVVLQVILRGTNMAINRMSRGKKSQQFDDGDFIEGEGHEHIDDRTVKRRARLTRRF